MTELISLSAHINSLGQIVDIIGVIVIFIFGLPSFERIHAGGYFLHEPDKDEQKEIDLYNDFSSIGLGLLISGFLCQLFSNYI